MICPECQSEYHDDAEYCNECLLKFEEHHLADNHEIRYIIVKQYAKHEDAEIALNILTDNGIDCFLTDDNTNTPYGHEGKAKSTAILVEKARANEAQKLLNKISGGNEVVAKDDYFDEVETESEKSKLGMLLIKVALYPLVAGLMIFTLFLFYNFLKLIF